MAPVSMHAHICTVCRDAGKQVVWVHGDDKKGDETAHKCPECGTLNWKQFLVEPHRVPAPHAVQTKGAFNYALDIFYVLVIVGCIAFLVYDHVTKKEGMPTP